MFKMLNVARIWLHARTNTNEHTHIYIYDIYILYISYNANVLYMKNMQKKHVNDQQSTVMC